MREDRRNGAMFTINKLARISRLRALEAARK